MKKYISPKCNKTSYCIFSTDFIFRQQKISLTIRFVRLNSGHYATKYYTCPFMYELSFLKKRLFAYLLSAVALAASPKGSELRTAEVSETL